MGSQSCSTEGKMRQELSLAKESTYTNEKPTVWYEMCSNKDTWTLCLDIWVLDMFDIPRQEHHLVQKLSHSTPTHRMESRSRTMGTSQMQMS